MSFGLKLDELPNVPPHGEVVAVLEFMPPGSDHGEQHAQIYAEDLHGMKIMKLAATCPPGGPDDDANKDSERR